jgi:hypothetical protein
MAVNAAPYQPVRQLPPQGRKSLPNGNSQGLYLFPRTGNPVLSTTGVDLCAKSRMRERPPPPPPPPPQRVDQISLSVSVRKTLSHTGECPGDNAHRVSASHYGDGMEFASRRLCHAGLNQGSHLALVGSFTWLGSWTRGPEGKSLTRHQVSTMDLLWGCVSWCEHDRRIVSSESSSASRVNSCTRGSRRFQHGNLRKLRSCGCPARSGRVHFR